MDSVTGKELLHGASVLLDEWRSVPALALLRAFIELPADQQGATPEEAASNRRDATALTQYITGGDFERARQQHQERQAAIARAAELVAEAAAAKRRKTKERQQRKAWIRAEVAALSRAGATRREMQVRLGCSGWEIGAAVNWNKRQGNDIAPQLNGAVHG